MQRSIVTNVLAAAALVSFAGVAEAATAINSQAGAWGPSKNPCRATPYFPAGGCLSSFFEDEERDLYGAPSAPYRPGRRLTAPALPAVQSGE
jgi:hypothetical protein